MTQAPPTPNRDRISVSSKDSSAGGKARAAYVRVRRLVPANSLTSALILGSTLLLVIVGLVIVLSASSVEDFAAVDPDSRTTEDFFRTFGRQAIFAAVGVPLMFIAANMPVKFWRRIAWLAIMFGILLQALVFTPLGFESGGNRNWLRFGSFSLQPSEFVKLALCVWLAFIMSIKKHSMTKFWHVWIPVAPVAGLALGLVMLGHDFGTVVIMAMLCFGALYFAGVRLWHLLLPIVVVCVAAVPIIQTSQSRIDRIQLFFNGCQPEDYFVSCWQQFHGLWAMSGGGIFGVGLGNSTAKWLWLAEANNDYIFAIIGEELGLVGATAIILIFVTLGLALLRVIRSTTDVFMRAATGGILVWVVGQALVNIAVVLGLLPVLGVPLPLISAGGSQTIAVLIAIGVVLSFCKEIDAKKAEGISHKPVKMKSVPRRERMTE
ncbi:peptidoglycan glycosyltransferase FtsW [Humidisolicoccus flavus]|uniref:peptidoglycan glycosyltransferase FtsW n=1 Tax=Humidisolicoccus flavus TaxID=3111414 RepID=UPI003246BAEA